MRLRHVLLVRADLHAGGVALMARAVSALVVAARALAAEWIRKQDAADPCDRVDWCSKCHRAVVGVEPINHAKDCIVGIALDAADAVEAQSVICRLDPTLRSGNGWIGEQDAPKPVGILDSLRAEVCFGNRLVAISETLVENFVTGKPVRHIEYSAAQVDGEDAPPETVTHEEAAAAQVGVFGGAR